MKRICKNCNVEKDIDGYYLKRNGKPKSSNCKECYLKKYKNEYSRDYYLNNIEMFRDNNKSWRIKNDRSEYLKKYRDDNKETLKEKNKEYRNNNMELVTKSKKNYWNNLPDSKKDEISKRNKELYHEKNGQYRKSKNEYINKKIKNDPFFKLKFNIRTLVRNSLKRKFTTKSKKTIDILGCSFEFFKEYLESKFDKNMNWDNQGSYWQLDHIKPISLALNEKEVYELNHYTNFQPLYWKENLLKSNK